MHFQFKFQQTKYRLEIISQQHIMCETSLSSLSDKFHIDEETENYNVGVNTNLFDQICNLGKKLKKKIWFMSFRLFAN